MEESELFISKQDDLWFAEHPDFQGLTAFGHTREEAIRSFMRMIEIIECES